MSSKQIILAYCTFPDVPTATRICEILVADGTIACANLMAPHQAIYKWQGAIQRESEIGAWLKTSINKKAVLREKIRAIHPYETPALVFFESAGGLPEFLNWVHAQSV